MNNWQNVREEIAIAINDSTTETEARNSVFSKSGILGRFKQCVMTLPREEKSRYFQEIELINSEAMKLLEAKFPKVDKQSIDATVETVYELGKLHPITEEINLIKRAMEKHGFVYTDGPIIDGEYYNFDALNVEEMHPARGMHDTFYLGSGKLLRTHTTNVDLRALEAKKDDPQPMKVFHVGRVYRKDDDRTHSTMFHQIDGLYVDHFNEVTIAHLQWFIREFLKDLLGCMPELRFRPSYFPFTEPSLEVDILTESVTQSDGSTLLRFVHAGENMKNGRWMEVLGGGMLCQNILKRANYNKHTAFAFGLGVDRIVMMKYGISNINDLYKNRFPFLRKYSVEGGAE